MTQPHRPSRTTSFGTRKRVCLHAAVLALGLLGTAACNDKSIATDSARPRESAAAKAGAAKKPAAKKSAPVKVAETAGQENARESAASYLSMSAFSRSGLIKQLEFEGYSKKDATYGVDKQNADWNAQAAKAARSYLDMTSFSRSGLVKQLMFEGYTRSQAEFGVKKVGL